jgi:hypothetical protein
VVCVNGGARQCLYGMCAHVWHSSCEQCLLINRIMMLIKHEWRACTGQVLVLCTCDRVVWHAIRLDAHHPALLHALCAIGATAAGQQSLSFCLLAELHSGSGLGDSCNIFCRVLGSS